MSLNPAGVVNEEDAEFNQVVANLKLHLTKVMNRAFPVGVPATKGAYVETGGSTQEGRFAGRFYSLYDRYLDRYIALQFVLNENKGFSVVVEEIEGRCDDGNVIVERATAAADWFANDGESEITLHTILEKIGVIIGSQKFKESPPNKRRQHYAYSAMGKGGRVRVVNDTDKNEYVIHYRSGANSNTSHVGTATTEDNLSTLGKFYVRIKQHAAISRVWHIGASQLVQNLIDAVPQNTFRQQLLLRPSYHYDVPFCDFVLERYPDVIVLRAHHDGYQFYRDGEFVTGVQNVEEIIAAPLTEEIVAKFPHELWRFGTGILYTSGELQDIELAVGRRHVKFVPFKRD